MNPWFLVVAAVLGFGAGWQTDVWRTGSNEKAAVVEQHEEFVKKDAVKEKIVYRYIERKATIQSKAQELEHEGQSISSTSCPALPDDFVGVLNKSIKEYSFSSGSPDGASSGVGTVP